MDLPQILLVLQHGFIHGNTGIARGKSNWFWLFELKHLPFIRKLHWLSEEQMESCCTSSNQLVVFHMDRVVVVFPAGPNPLRGGRLVTWNIVTRVLK